MKFIDLTKGYKAIVDDEDFERVSQYKWYALIQEKVNSTYVCPARQHYNNKITGKPKYSRMGRFILNAPTNLQVDHIDGNPLNNQKSNLRLVTNQQNQMNCGSKNNKTGYKGISYMKAIVATSPNLKKPYMAHIMFNRKHIYLGYFKTAKEAAKAYDSKAKELFGEFAKTNF